MWPRLTKLGKELASSITIVSYNCLSLMLHPSFETLALLHKSFGHLLENIMIILWKGVIRKCQLVNCESKSLRVVRYLANNLRVNPSASCELYYFAHCFKSRNGSNQICVKGVALEQIFFLEKKCSHNLTIITNITLIRVIRKKSTEIERRLRLP